MRDNILHCDGHSERNGGASYGYAAERLDLAEQGKHPTAMAVRIAIPVPLSGSPSRSRGIRKHCRAKRSCRMDRAVESWPIPFPVNDEVEKMKFLSY